MNNEKQLIKFRQKGFSTRALHIGSHPDETTGAIMPPIYQTSTYVQKSPGVHQGYEYSRSHNPTRSRLEECLAALENADYALVTSSGLAAISLVMHALDHQSRVFCGDDVYGGTYRLFTTVFQNTHQFTFLDTTDTAETTQKIKTQKPHLVWLESPTNPTLKISDIKEICLAAKEVGALVVVDNTFMSPYFQQPLTLGADLVMHSMTKYINGHSDVVGGVIMTSNESFYKKLFTLQNSMGPSQSPFDSWLVLRGLKTLKVRMKEHEKNALEVARFLENHEQVEKVIYPGLPSHPQHELALKQASGFSGMITFFLKGGLRESKIFLESLNIFSLAESLGGVESLIEHPAIMTHASVPKEIREQIGIHDNLIRLSVGLEDIDDLIEDLQEAFKQIK